nr:oligosaccharide flippase family protein [uncultured Vibrio sp.]
MNIKAILNLLSSNVGSQILLFLFLPYISATYKPEVFGQWVIFTSISTVTVVICNLRLDTQIVICDELDVERIVSAGLCSTLLFIMPAVIFSVVIFDFSTFLCVMLVINIIFSSRLQIENSISTRRGQYSVLSLSKLLQTISLIFTIYVMSKINASGFTLAMSTSISSFVACLFYYFSNKYKSVEVSYRMEIRNLTWAYKKYHSHIKYDLPTVLLNNLSSNIPLWVIQFVWGNHMAGLYGLAHRTINLPISMISLAVGKVFYKDMSVSNDNLKLFYKYISVSVFVYTLPFIVFYSYTEEFYEVFFGLEWRESGEIARLILPWMFFVLCVSPLTYLHFILKSQRLNYYSNIALFSIRILVVLFSYYILKSDMFSFLWLYVLVSVIYWIWQLLIMAKLLLDSKRVLNDPTSV